MKVAWLFAGLPRSPEFMSEHFLRLMKLYDSTVVAHFWSCDENGIEEYSKSEWKLVGTKQRRIVKPDTYTTAIEDFKRIYNPTSMLVEPCSPPLSKGKVYRSYYGQFSAQRALSLINPLDFDVIVKCRTDVVIHPKEVNNLAITDKNVLYTVGDFFDPKVRVNDTFFYGHPNVMVPLLNSVDLFFSLNGREARDVHLALTKHCKRLLIPVICIDGPRSGRKVGK